MYYFGQKEICCLVLYLLVLFIIGMSLNFVVCGNTKILKAEIIDNNSETKSNYLNNVGYKFFIFIG